MTDANRKTTRGQLDFVAMAFILLILAKTSMIVLGTIFIYNQQIAK
jgi:hypothetical protein